MRLLLIGLAALIALLYSWDASGRLDDLEVGFRELDHTVYEIREKLTT